MANKKRVLLKISGELFQSEGEVVDYKKILAVANEIVKTHKDYDLGIVIGGGNIFRGRNVKELGLNMATAHYTGMTATIVNALALKNVLDSLNVPNRIISALGMPDVLGSNCRISIEKHINRGEILIFAGGTGNPYVSTDTGAVIKALEIGAEILLKGTKVMGIFDKDPKQDSTAKQFKKLTYGEYRHISGAFILDKTAALLAEENRLPIYVFKWGQGNLKKAVKQKAGGTIIQ